ncbi:MAG: acyl-CoA dehydratase activase [Dehalococcoidia bacterium]
MAWYMGIDIGSAFSKGIIINDAESTHFQILRSGINYRTTANIIRQELMSQANLLHDDIVDTVATGSGANNVAFSSRKISDIICTARGINSLFPQVRTIIDAAGQSTKLINIDSHGRVTSFVVSEKCAAGSGWFIEVVANVLRTDLNEFSRLSQLSDNPIAFSTSCAVFGESEAISRVAEGIPKEDIAAGVNKTTANKISSLFKKISIEEPCAICGGGGLNAGLVDAIEVELKIKMLMPPQPQSISCLGAAVIARTSGS